MKTLRCKTFILVKFFTLTLILILNHLDASSIQFGNHTIFYGVGQDTFSGYWTIASSRNTFSDQNIGTFYSNTQLYILSHSFQIYHDEGDSLIVYNYRCRYYKKHETIPEWFYFDPIMGSAYQHASGIWMTSGHIDTSEVFTLPLDTGVYYLEFEHEASVVDTNGDTLTKTMILADSADYKAEFTILQSSQSGSESSTHIELSSFEGKFVKGKVKLTWLTESETENSHFLIYRDGEVIAQIEGAGTASESNEYEYVDEVAVPGTHSYAIADVSFGGIEEIHPSVKVEVKLDTNDEVKDFVLNAVYPNPFNSSVALNFQLSTINKVRAFIYNTNGEMIKELLTEKKNVGSHTLTWNAEGMPSGVYIVKMVVGDPETNSGQVVVKSQKVVLMK